MINELVFNKIMNLQGQKKRTKPTLKDKLIDKIKILKEIQSEELTTISYTNAQFILNSKKIKQNIITMFLKQLYKDSFAQINQNWFKGLADNKIVEDFFAIKRKSIDQQWTTESLQKKRIQQNELRIKSYTEKVGENRHIRDRIKALKNQMNILQAKIDMAKKDEQATQFRQQYASAKLQYTFWTNKNRRLKQLKEQKSTLNNEQTDKRMIDDIQRKIEVYSLQKQRSRYLQTLAVSASVNSTPKRQERFNQESKNRLKKLEDVFQIFSKKQGKQSMLFGQMESSKDMITLENFLKMVSDTKIDSHLTLQERVHIFKESSQYSKKIDFLNFTTALKEICIKNCEKLKIKFDAKIMDIFLDQFINKLAENSRLHSYPETFNNVKVNDAPSRDKLSKYKYKLICHSGKCQQNMQDDLSQRKKIKDVNRMKREKQYISINNDTNKFSRIKTEQHKVSFDSKVSSVRPESKPRDRMISLQSQNQEASKNTAISQLQMSNNYANIFQRRKMVQGYKRKRYMTEVKTPTSKQASQNNSDLKTHKTFIQNISNHKETPSSVHQKEDQELRQIIEYEDDDPFLTSHVYREKVGYPSFKKPFKVHF